MKEMTAQIPEVTPVDDTHTDTHTGPNNNGSDNYYRGTWHTEPTEPNLEQWSESPYDLLKVDTTIDKAGIKVAYRTAGKALGAPSDSNKEAWQKINWAYSILSDSELRARYDNTTVIHTPQYTSTTQTQRRPSTRTQTSTEIPRYTYPTYHFNPDRWTTSYTNGKTIKGYPFFIHTYKEASVQVLSETDMINNYLDIIMQLTPENRFKVFAVSLTLINLGYPIKLETSLRIAEYFLEMQIVQLLFAGQLILKLDSERTTR